MAAVRKLFTSHPVTHCVHVAAHPGRMPVSRFMQLLVWLAADLLVRPFSIYSSECNLEYAGQ